MDGEGQFWLRLWGTVLCAVVALGVTIAVSATVNARNGREHIDRLVAAGASPIAAACAVWGVGDRDAALCAIATRN